MLGLQCGLRRWSAVIFAAAWAASCPSPVVADDCAEKPRRPNIVLILADDLGYGDAPSYNAAAKVPMPNVDRLAGEGMRFTDAHSGSSVCTPTRYGLLTGRYAWRTHLQDRVFYGYEPPLIAAGRPTLGTVLQGQGYHTACIGKWHLGWDWPMVAGAEQPDFTQAIGGGPTTRGFDEYFGTHVPNQAPYCFIDNDRTVGLPTAWKEVDRKILSGRAGPMLPGWKFEEILPTITRRAVRYLDERAAAGEPFFLYMPLTTPHEPITPSEFFQGRSGINPVADLMMETDWAVGEVLAALDRHRLADDTLVIFTADNGHATYTGLEGLLAAGHQPSGPLRGYKTDIYEGGHRVHFIARKPGLIAPRTTNDALICLTAMLPTFAELVGAKLPETAAEDGASILPLLRGETPATPTFEAVVHHSVSGQFAIRRGRWKLIFPKPAKADAAATTVKEAASQHAPSQQAAVQPLELYDLVADIGETTNVADKQPGIVTKLTALMERLVAEGRSTPGARQANDVAVDIWKRR